MISARSAARRRLRTPPVAVQVALSNLQFTRLPPAHPGSTPVRLYQAIRSGGGVTYMPEAAKALRRRGFSVQQISLTPPEVAYLRAQGAAGKVDAKAFVVECPGRVGVLQGKQGPIIHCGPPPAELVRPQGSRATVPQRWPEDATAAASEAAGWINDVATARKWTPAQRRSALTLLHVALTQPDMAGSPTELFTRLVQRWRARAPEGNPPGWDKVGLVWRGAVEMSGVTAGDRGSSETAVAFQRSIDGARGVVGDAVRAAQEGLEATDKAARGLVREATISAGSAGREYLSPALAFVKKSALSNVQFFAAASGITALSDRVMKEAGEAKRLWSELNAFYGAYAGCMESMGTAPVDQAERNDLVQIRNTLARFAQPASMFQVTGSPKVKLGAASIPAFSTVGAGDIFAVRGAIPAGMLLSDSLPSIEEARGALGRMKARACAMIARTDKVSSLFKSKSDRRSLACLAQVCGPPKEGLSTMQVGAIAGVTALLGFIGLRRWSRR